MTTRCTVNIGSIPRVRHAIRLISSMYANANNRTTDELDNVLVALDDILADNFDSIRTTMNLSYYVDFDHVVTTADSLALMLEHALTMIPSVDNDSAEYDCKKFHRTFCQNMLTV